MVKTDHYVDVFHPCKRYGIIYTDPPWQQRKGGYRKARPHSSGTSLDYPVMSTQAIMEFHKITLPLLAEERHNVFMWTIDKYLIDTERIMKELGYIRHARIIWNKQKGMAPAFTLRFTCEYLLWFYQKGKMLMPDVDSRGKYATYLQESVHCHSRKPECAYEMLEDLFKCANKVELFARKPRNGWDCWGNEVSDFEEKSNGRKAGGAGV